MYVVDVARFESVYVVFVVVASNVLSLYIL